MLSLIIYKLRCLRKEKGTATSSLVSELIQKNNEEGGSPEAEEMIKGLGATSYSGIVSRSLNRRLLILNFSGRRYGLFAVHSFPYSSHNPF